MQFAKDSFYMAMRERLAALNPARTVTLNGATRPAVIAGENEPVGFAERLPNAFYLDWGATRPIKSHQDGTILVEMDCTIWYHTLGASDSGVDRGRALGELEQELWNICQPPRTPKRDFTQAPSQDLGTMIFWRMPQNEDLLGSDRVALRQNPGARLERRARLSIFFFPEVQP